MSACPDPNCVDGISWHVEPDHDPGCEGGCERCPIAVQVQHRCDWPGHEESS